MPDIFESVVYSKNIINSSYSVKIGLPFTYAFWLHWINSDKITFNRLTKVLETILLSTLIREIGLTPAFYQPFVFAFLFQQSNHSLFLRIGELNMIMCIIHAEAIDQMLAYWPKH